MKSNHPKLPTRRPLKEIEEFSSEELNHAQDLLKSADLDKSLKSILGACLKRVIEGVEYHFSDFFLATSSDDWARRVTDGDSVPLSTISTLKRVQDLTSNLIAKGLQTSSKLVVDQHGQRVRLRDPIDKTAMDESKSRIIVVEDVTVDKFNEELKKLYSKFGEVIRVRTCQSSGTLITFVEYKEVDDAIEAGQTSNDGDHSINDFTRIHCAGLQSPGRMLGQTSNNSDHSISDFARTHYAGLQISEGTLSTAKWYYESFKDLFKTMVKEVSVFLTGIEAEDPYTSRELGIKEGTMKKKESMVAHLKADSSVVFLKESVVKPSKIAARYCCRLGIQDGQEIGRICRAADRVSSIQLPT